METGHKHCRISLGAFCLLTLLLVSGPVQAATLTVTWDANTEPDLAGYKVYYGTASGAYGAPVFVDAQATSCQLANLDACTTYYIAVTAFDTSANESAFSQETSATTSCEGLNTYWRDADGDGWGDAAVSTQAAQAPAGYVANNTDCDDSDASVHPGAPEVCDGADNDCDGQVDEGAAANTYYRDADGDGYGDAAVSTTGCQAPAGFVANNWDCDDTNAAVHPAAAEVCDGADNDCDGQVDEGLVLNTYWRDADGDGYGDAAGAVLSCQTPAGHVSNAADCDDTNAAVHPGAVEVCGDGIDQDCDGMDAACPDHFEAPAPGSGCLVASGEVMAAGAPAQPGDEIAVFDADGVCCGAFRVAQVGLYGPLYINLDNPLTPQDEGATNGERLIFKLWRQATDMETVAHLEVVSQEGAAYEVNLAGYYQETIPLRAGWNLVSFTTAVCYYTGEEPPAVPMLEGVRFQQVASLNDVLASIDNKYEVVRGFDAGGTHTFDPAAPAFSDLDYLAPGYGYWIKATEDCELELTGGRVSPLSRLALTGGWNLVGYWGHEVNHLGAAPEVAFTQPPGSLTLNQVQEAGALFAAIEGMYSAVKAFDEDGAHSLRPGVPGFLSDLRYAGPGYGYWVRMNGNAQLSY